MKPGRLRDLAIEKRKPKRLCKKCHCMLTLDHFYAADQNTCKSCYNAERRAYRQARNVKGLREARLNSTKAWNIIMTIFYASETLTRDLIEYRNGGHVTIRSLLRVHFEIFEGGGESVNCIKNKFRAGLNYLKTLGALKDYQVSKTEPYIRDDGFTDAGENKKTIFPVDWQVDLWLKTPKPFIQDIFGDFRVRSKLWQEKVEKAKSKSTPKTLRAGSPRVVKRPPQDS